MLYIRDLKPELREQIEDQIRKERPDLAAAMDEGEDIQIGEVWRSDKFEKTV